MAAVYAILTPSEFLPHAASFAVVADDTQAHYVFPPGIDAGQLGLDDERIANVSETIGVKPVDALHWLQLAAYNVGYYTLSNAIDAPDIEAATTAAQQRLSTTPDGTAPQTRQELLSFQQNAMYAWAQLYPEAASGDVDDPEADLGLVQLLTPPVNPAEPHDWLPIATTETDCGFCEQPENAAIHRPSADTITSGSK